MGRSVNSVRLLLCTISSVQLLCDQNDFIFIFIFFVILVTAIGGRSKPEFGCCRGG